MSNLATKMALSSMIMQHYKSLSEHYNDPKEELIKDLRHLLGDMTKDQIKEIVSSGRLLNPSKSLLVCADSLDSMFKSKSVNYNTIASISTEVRNIGNLLKE